MLKIRSLNNATTVVEGSGYSLLIDPWLVGTLYGGAWSPYAKMKDVSFLKSISHVFISHIHEDHWDRETLLLLDKSAKIFIPKLPINNVLKRYVEELGFSDIQLITPLEKYDIGDAILTIIPPLNAFGQELGSYVEGYEFDSTHIDTGLLVEDKASETSHLFLCDNSPYDLEILKNIHVNDLTTLWYPFNSYAQDYPLCYEMDDQAKADIHDVMQSNTMKAVFDCLALMKPRYYLPHSADFVLNGPMADKFDRYTKPEFMKRDMVAKTYEFPELETSKSEYALYGDVLTFENKSDMSIKRDVYDYDKVTSLPYLETFNSKLRTTIEETLAQSFEQMIERCTKHSINLEKAANWVLTLTIDGTSHHFSYDSLKLMEQDHLTSEKKQLEIFLSEDQVTALLSRELHWNNAQIGCHYKSKRVPNEYCQTIYKSLNFLHL